MDVVCERCAGLDVHKKTVVACVALWEPLADKVTAEREGAPKPRSHRSVATRYERRTLKLGTQYLFNDNVMEGHFNFCRGVWPRCLKVRPS